MSDYSKVASDSMKQLTEKVIKADLASRKIRNLNMIARRYPLFLWLPVVAYIFYVIIFNTNNFQHTINYRGRLKSVNAQAGDPINIWKMLFAGHIAPLREVMRPGINLRNELKFIFS